MHIFGALKWINRRGAFVGLLMLLLGAGAMAHLMAVERLKMTGGQLAVMDAANTSRVGFIGYIDGHAWVALPYVAVFATCLVWCEFRQTPRRSLWSVFMLLAVPALCYMWICLRVGTELLRLRSIE